MKIFNNIFGGNNVPIIPRFRYFQERGSFLFSWLFLHIYDINENGLGFWWHLFTHHEILTIRLRLIRVSIDIVIPWPLGLGFRLYFKDYKERYKRHKEFNQRLYT